MVVRFAFVTFMFGLFLHDTSVHAVVLQETMAEKIKQLDEDDFAPKNDNVLKLLLSPISEENKDLAKFKRDPYKAASYLTEVQIAFNEKGPKKAKVKPQKKLAQYLAANLSGNGVWGLNDRMMGSRQQKIFVRAAIMAGKGMSQDEYNLFENDVFESIEGKITDEDSFHNKKNRHRFFTYLFTTFSFKGIDQVNTIIKMAVMPKITDLFSDILIFNAMCCRVWEFLEQNIDVLNEERTTSLQDILKNKAGISTSALIEESYRTYSTDEKWDKHLFNHHLKRSFRYHSAKYGKQKTGYESNNDESMSAITGTFKFWKETLERTLDSQNFNDLQLDIVKERFYALAFMLHAGTAHKRDFAITDKREIETYINLALKRDAEETPYVNLKNKLEQTLLANKKMKHTKDIHDRDHVADKMEAVKIDFAQSFGYVDPLPANNSSLLEKIPADQTALSYQEHKDQNEYDVHVIAYNIDEDQKGPYRDGTAKLKFRMWNNGKDKANLQMLMNIKKPSFWYFRTIKALLAYDPDQKKLIRITGINDLTGFQTKFCAEEIMK